MDINNLKSKAILKNIDWNFFKKTDTYSYEVCPFNPRKHHWYPATFITEIPYTLIEVLTKENDIVFDPFGGIGTTFFQSILLNRIPITVENCNVAVEVIKSLFTLLNPRIDKNSIKSQIFTIAYEYRSNIEYEKILRSNSLSGELKSWYEYETFNMLCYLMYKENICNNEEMKAIFRIEISSMLKAMSSQDRGWGCIADNMIPKKDQMKRKDVINSFVLNSLHLIDDIDKCLKSVRHDYNTSYFKIIKNESIFHENIINFTGLADESVDIVITSPPYPNMTDYATSQRLSYYYLGYKVSQKELNDLNNEIGARIKRFKSTALEQYINDMKNANKVIAKTLKRGGYACFVMPFFQKNEKDLKRQNVIEDVINDLKNYNLNIEDVYERVIPSKRRSQNFKWATLEKEKIYLLRKM